MLAKTVDQRIVKAMPSRKSKKENIMQELEREFAEPEQFLEGEVPSSTTI